MEEIKQASDSMQYEKAAYLRDKKLAIEAITERQKYLIYQKMIQM